jgi:hypothetical protein
MGWTHVKIARIERGALADLLVEAWRLVAPKRLIAAHSGGDALPPATQRAAARKNPSAPKKSPVRRPLQVHKRKPVPKRQTRR